MAISTSSKDKIKSDIVAIIASGQSYVNTAKPSLSYIWIFSIANALMEYGSGGGHKTMAGGFISRESIKKYGKEYDKKIETLFLNQYENMIAK